MPNPRPSQIKLIEDIKQSIGRGNKRLIAAAPTGFGKSVTMACITRMVQDKAKIRQKQGRVIIVLPRRSLVIQLSGSFKKYGIMHSVIMSKERRNLHSNIQIASIDSYMSWVGSGRIDLFDADLLMIDEMHTQFSNKKIELFKKYPLVIGFSATPVAPGNQSLGVFYDDIVESISMRELIDQGLLSPLRYFSPTDFHLETIKLNLSGEYRESELISYVDDKLRGDDGKKALVGDIYQNWKRIASDRKTVIFCSSQAHARFVTDEFKSKGIKSEYVDCTTPDEERGRIFDGMEHGDVQVICNVGIISMGIDIPNISCVVLARPIKLLSNYLQCVGRGTRTHESKIDTIIIDHCGIVCSLGFAEDEQFWSLDGKESPEQRKQRAKEEAKAPKEIKCKCGMVFKYSRICPSCGFEMISKGEAMPTHHAELKEILTSVKKPAPAEKADWYAQMLYISRSKGYKDGWAANKFKEKFNEWPKRKNGVVPVQPGPDVLRFIQHLNIKRARATA